MRAVWRVLRLGASARWRVAAAVALGAAAAATAVALAGTSAWLIVRAAEHPPVLHLMVAIVAVRAFGIGRGVLRYVERLLTHDAAFRVLGALRVRVVGQAERLLPGCRRLFGEGDLLARFVGEVDGLADLWVRVLVPGLAATAVGVGAVAGLTGLLPVGGLVLAVTLVLAGVVVPLAGARLARAAGRDAQPARARYQERLLALVDGARELEVYGALDRRLDALAADDDALAGMERRSAWTAGLASAVAVLAAGGGALVALWASAGALERGSLDGAGLAVVVLVPLAVHEVVALWVPVAAQLPALAASSRRLVEVLDAADPTPVPAAPMVVPDGALAVTARHLTLGWPGAAPLLEDLSFHVPAGGRVAITGPSGTGKSTLAATLLGFVPAVEGALLLVADDGSAVAPTMADSASLHRAVGWCEQDPHVFDSTVAANLRLARPDASDEALRAALQTVRLGDWLAGLPDGLATMVGEHGRALSGGERQRLALARVLLSGARVVVIDEPTEHVDDATATVLLDDLLRALAGRTVIVITHRRDLIEHRVEQVVDVGAMSAPPSQLA